MKTRAKSLLTSLVMMSLASPSWAAHASSMREDGPFPTVSTSGKPFNFKMQIKLEGPTTINYPCVLQGSAVATVTSVDPVTNKPMTQSVPLSAGTVITGSEGYVLQKGVTVVKDAVSNASLNIGRYAYIGDVPRFEPKNLEMFVSKMSHTLRVKAWVTQDTIDNYEKTMILRWNDRYTDFNKSVVHLVPMKNLNDMVSKTRDGDTKKIYQVASYYSKHYLDNPNLNIYDQGADEQTYRNNILLEMLRKNMNDETLSVQDGLNLANQYLTNPNQVSIRRAQSQVLFTAHLGSRFNDSVDVEKQRVGYLTFVYPIAIDMKGPFGDPSPGIRKFPQKDSMEARWWSDRWMDEFGGFPFLQITSDGVAFHGPITLNGGVWFLRRADVSHSCMRMDPSDVLELRELLPKDIYSLEQKKNTVPLQIMEWPDVTDLNNDGNLEVIDVAYYLMQGNGSAINNPLNWKPKAIQSYFWKKTFSPYFLGNGKTFTITTQNGPDGQPVNQGVFTGLPQYLVQNGTLVQSGTYAQSIPIETLPMRPTAIIQYKEDGVVYDQNYHDQTINDSKGVYPPSKPQHGN